MAHSRSTGTSSAAGTGVAFSAATMVGVCARLLPCMAIVMNGTSGMGAGATTGVRGLSAEDGDKLAFTLDMVLTTLAKSPGMGEP